MEKKKISNNKIRPCGFCCIKVKNLGVEFGDSQVLRDVNMHIHCGTISAIIGRNGAGKSTFFRALLGEVEHSGQVEFRDFEDGVIKHLKIGYVPQKLDIDRNTPMSVYDFITAFQYKKPLLFKSKKLYEEILTELRVFSAEDLIDKPIGTLSGGQLQRVLLAMSCYDKPNLLLLDEPVSGIDQNGMDEFYENMKFMRDHFDMAIVIISHDLDYVAKYADNVYLLDQTITASGSPKKVFETEAFKQVFKNVSIATDQADKSGEAKTEASKLEPFDASYKGGKSCK